MIGVSILRTFLQLLDRQLRQNHRNLLRSLLRQLDCSPFSVLFLVYIARCVCEAFIAGFVGDHLLLKEDACHFSYGDGPRVAFFNIHLVGTLLFPISLRKAAIIRKTLTASVSSLKRLTLIKPGFLHPTTQYMITVIIPEPQNK